MSSRRLEWAVAGVLAGWAAVRLAGADRLELAEHWTVPLLSFTPQVTAGAWAATLLLRSPGPSTGAALASAALTAAVAPRALRSPQPAATGPVLRVLTANLLVGRAEAGAVADLVRSTDADVLFVQELTDEAEVRLERAGLNDLFAHRLTHSVAVGPRGSGIYARYPLTCEAPAEPASAAQITAGLHLPSGQVVRLVCVHAPSPKPLWNQHATARWNGELAALPAPGGPPLILAGDFNATLDHAQFRRLLHRGLVDAASQTGNGLMPTWGPRAQRRPAVLAIDHILVDAQCAVLSTSAHRLSGSDHRALFARLRLPAPAD
jgi:endonuclease/exonuclease/phosphatase family metal-dependent hydrolase